MSRRIKISSDRHMIQDVSSAYGIDAVSQLESMLSKELSDSIDREIIKDLMKHSSIADSTLGKLRDLLTKHVRDRNLDTII